MRAVVSRIITRHLLTVAMGVAVLSFGVSSTAFAGLPTGGDGDWGSRRGCWVDKPCDYNHEGYSSGFCDYDGGHNACYCYDFQTGAGEGSCSCATGQYSPCN